MSTREQFGSYLLLKKLTEDPLGETFRAGKVTAQGMGRVVLLRTFNGAGIDAGALWSRISDRGPVQEALTSPNLGAGVDLGQVQQVPYVAYDYISGKNLATLQEQAVKAKSPIPTDHAMLIAERLALGLAVAYESRLEGNRLLHGFVVPQLLMLSNEGETRVLGFEAAPGLRAATVSAPDSYLGRALSRYLAPEVRQGAPLSKADDVYSLGAIFYELLTGHPLPEAPDGNYGPVIDRATLANEGTSLPEPINQLLQRSLAPTRDRIQDAATWHKALSKVMSESQYNPTTFNLAFFMHNLFRDEIELESKEIEVEQTLAAPVATAAATSASTTSIPAPDLGTGQPEAASAETTAEPLSATADESAEKKGGNKGLLMGLAALLLLAVLAGAYYQFVYSKGGAPEDETQLAQESIPAATTPNDADPLAADGSAGGAGEGEEALPSPDEIRAQLDQMLEEKTAAMEASLREQYDQRIQGLQQQLESSQEAAAEWETRRKEAEAAAQKAAEEEAAQQKAEEERVAAEAAAQQKAEEEAAAQKKADEERLAAEAAAKKKAEEEKARAKPKVRIGDLVEPGPGVIAPKRKGSIEPRYPEIARRLNKEATVVVRALVNINGRVETAELAGQKVGFGFDEAALVSARSTRFEPATKDGVRVKMWTTLRISFKP